MIGKARSSRPLRPPAQALSAVLLVALAHTASAQIAPKVPPSRPPAAVITPRLPTLQPQAPDLVIASIRFDRKAVTYGAYDDPTKDADQRPQWVDAVVTIRNAGAADAILPGNALQVKAEGGPVFVAAPFGVDVTLAPGAQREVHLSGPTPCAAVASTTTTFRVDPDNRVAETNETNNSTSVAVPLPDYSAADLVVDSAYLVAGSRILRVWVKNAGSVGALLCPQGNNNWPIDNLWWMTQGPAAVGLPAPAALMTAAAMGPAHNWKFPTLLRPGEIAWTTLDLPTAQQLPAGQYGFRIEVNRSHKFPEQNTGNNARTLTLTLP